ncbi:hypothetical protein Micbo1qcDRAFT_172904 [Microdochium bolleyi]|uniref:Uncharacterized protein n=1 Tax=Microdochium bolleyi TaxID=196109 RepID=A0A136JA78_9PEZI|nr:hypothetical protein Micbo1qcDRAFT_172904 [Microdochium bolleyi]
MQYQSWSNARINLEMAWPKVRVYSLAEGWVPDDTESSEHSFAKMMSDQVNKSSRPEADLILQPHDVRSLVYLLLIICFLEFMWRSHFDSAFVSTIRAAGSRHINSHMVSLQAIMHARIDRAEGLSGMSSKHFGFVPCSLGRNSKQPANQDSSRASSKLREPAVVPTLAPEI